MRNYWRLKKREYANADTSSTTRPQPTHCEVCGTEAKGRNMQWDHNHVTGKFRGWLCGHCNRAAGQARDNTTILRALAAYIERDGKY